MALLTSVLTCDGDKEFIDLGLHFVLTMPLFRTQELRESVEECMPSCAVLLVAARDWTLLTLEANFLSALPAVP